MTDIVIVSAARTPVGSFNGAFAAAPAHELGKTAITGALQRAKVDPKEVSEVVLGQVLTANQGMNPARQASRAAGVPDESPAWSLNQVCGSGLRAVVVGYQQLKAGDAKIVVAGGQENMSLSPHAAHLRAGQKMGDLSFSDTMIKDGLTDVFNQYHMGITAENVAEKWSKVEQVARLIRSKGVGVYFITQNPADVPEVILGQLRNRVQHGLRAFTAKDQKDLAKAAETYRPHPRFAIEEAIRDVGTGEAVTSFLEAKGIPGVAERTLIRPPASQLGPIEPSLRAAVMAGSGLGAKYTTPIDRDSAWERLRARPAKAAREAEAEAVPEAEEDREFSRARRYDGGPTAPSAPTAIEKRSTGAPPSRTEISKARFRTTTVSGSSGPFRV